jgi:NitT/TauT family transport system substrate-binding protein
MKVEHRNGLTYDILIRDLSRREVLKLAGVGAGTLSLGGLLAACGAGSPAASTGATTKVTDQLGWLALPQFAGYYAAQELGYYRKVGIDATLVPGGPNLSSTQITATGASQFGDENDDNALEAIGKGTPVKIFGALFQKSPYAVMSLPNAPIQTLADFQGKTIAILEATKIFMVPLMKAQGLDPGKVHWVPAAPDPSVLLSGSVQGYTGYATDQGVTLKQQNVPVIITLFHDLGLKSYANMMMARADYIDKHHDLVVGYLRATSKGYRYVNQHPDEWGQKMATKYGPPGLKADTEVAVCKAQAPLIESEKGPCWFDTARQETIIQQDYDLKVIATRLTLDQVVATKIVHDAWSGWTADDSL